MAPRLPAGCVTGILWCQFFRKLALLKPAWHQNFRLGIKTKTGIKLAPEEKIPKIVKKPGIFGTNYLKNQKFSACFQPSDYKLK